MAVESKLINELLFRAGKTIDIYPGDEKTGHRTSASDCKANTIRDAFKESGSVTLNCAAFLIKAIMKEELRLAVSRDTVSDKGTVYGEFTHYNKSDGSTSVWGFTYTEGGKMEPTISYMDDAPEDGSPYEILPYVIGKILLSDNNDFADELVATFVQAFDKPTNIKSAYRFCDSFYFHVKDVWEEKEILIEDHALSAGSVKEARKMGRFFDVGNPTEELPVGCNLNNHLLEALRMGRLPIKPCEVFEDVKVNTADTKKAAEKTPDVSWEKVLNDIKIGKYFVSHEWTESQQSHIPPLSYLDTFIPSEEFYEVLRKIEYRIGNHMVTATELGNISPDDIKNDIVNVLLYGDPGSGKTAMVHALAAATQMPLYSIKFNEDSEDDVFEGKNRIVEGKVAFVETDFLEGFEKGGIILMEEINLGRANMLTSVMNQAMEYPFYVEKNGYQKITRHPLVVAFATMNLDTDGTTTLNSAMAQRFNNKYMIGEPTAAQFKERLIANGFIKERVDFVYNIYAKIRDYLKENTQRQKYLKELSMRQCIAALQNMEEGTSFRRSIFNTMYGAICIKNRKLADQIKEAILDTYPDYRGE